jgi:hypothetical protein
MIAALLRKWRLHRRRKWIMRHCNNVCRCPHCGDMLNDQAQWISMHNEDGELTGEGWYLCLNCGRLSRWHFALAPVPVLLEGEG